MKYLVCLVTCALLFITASAASAQTISAFYVAPNGSDSNPGTLSAPFATLAAARRAMEQSSTKITYIRAGTYHPAADPAGDGTQALYLGPADSDETWSYYQSDGVASAVIDGGSSSASSGLRWGIYISGASDVTVDGLQLQNFANVLLQATNGASGTQFINNVLHDTYNNVDYAGIGLWGSAPNSIISHNYIYNIVNHGILASTCNGSCAGGMTGVVISYNVVDNTCTISTDCGAIYLQDYASPRSTGITVKQNFIHDVNPSGDSGGRGIYLDDGTSNVTATQNVVSGNKVACFTIHGGDSDVYSDNLCDEESAGDQSILLYQASSSSALNMVNNVVSNNIIIAGSSGGGQGYSGDGAPNPATIDNNIYFNYAGSSVVYGGSGGSGSDSHPTYADPQLSTWCYTAAASSPAFAAPVSFLGIEQTWGPPNFVIPTVGTPPSSPHDTGCANLSPLPTVALAASPAVVGQGQSSMLTWRSSNADGCSSASFATGGAISGSAAIVPAATTTYSVTCSGSGGSAAAQTVVSLQTKSVESPYGGKPWPVPGKIEADNYDVGGNGVAYFTTASGNPTGDYRNDDIGIQATTDTATCTGMGCPYNVGYTAAGEWLNYTVNVASSGTYTASLRVADRSSGASLHIDVDGAPVASFSIPNTGGWQTWTTLGKKVPLSAGTHIVRVAFDTDDGVGWAGTLHWIRFARK